MKTFLLVVLFIFSIHPHIQAQPPKGKGYVLLFEELFTGDRINQKDWRYRIDRRQGYGYMDGLNRKENVYVKDSALHIVLNHEMINGKWENTGGGIISNHDFGYGYYECLSKPFMAGHGVHTSFWQRGSRYAYNNIFEIDSYEVDSKTFVATNNLYFDLGFDGSKRRPWPHRAQVPFSLDKDGWFLDAYELTPDGIFFYDNGKIVAYAEWDQLNAKQNVWLTALNGVGKVDTAFQPAESVFKYFKFYAKDYPGITILPNGNFEYNQDLYDATHPLCWITEGTESALHIVKGDAFFEQYKLRIGKAEPYNASIKQHLEYIMNGDYQLSFMIRNSNKAPHSFVKISNHGGKDIVLDIPSSSTWKNITIPNIHVSNHQVDVAISSEGKSDEWIDIDDVLFLKPHPAKQIIRAKPFSRPKEAFWSLAEQKPIEFTGDQKFYFFDRNVGFGDSISIEMDITAAQKTNMTPIARIPKKGNDGWSISLMNDGGLMFRIGSIESHTDILASNIYEADKSVHIACTFENGVASIYKNGTLVKQQKNILHHTKDASAAGKLGTVGKDFEAVGEVVMQLSHDDKENNLSKNFRGTIAHLRIYNRIPNND